jgi:hypothetical protein
MSTACLTLEFVRQCLTLHAHRFAYLREGAAPPKQRKRKPAFRRRVVNALPPKKGDLWLMFRTGDRHDADDAGNVTAGVRALATRRRLGRYTGASVGDASADISFVVARQSEAAQAIADFLDKEYPGIYYILSDEYEDLTRFSGLADVSSLRLVGFVVGLENVTVYARPTHVSQ